MHIKVEIRRWVDDSNPGWVECSLTDASGNQHLFVEKEPVVSKELLSPDSSYPQPGCIACSVVGPRRDNAGRDIVKVSTVQPWDIESTTGETEFELFRDQIADEG